MILGLSTGVPAGAGLVERIGYSTAATILFLTLSSAAYIAIHIHTPWKPFISAFVVAAIFSLMSLIANLDAEIILPAAVWAGSVSAVSTSDSTLFHVGVIDKIVAISLYAAMLAVAVFTLSR